MIVDPSGAPIGTVDKPTPTQLAREIEAFTRRLQELPAHSVDVVPGFIVGQTSPLELFTLVALVQLAARHPSLSPFHHAVAEGFIDGALDVFTDCPAVCEAIRRGDDPVEDV